jgi:hypothetical protein
VRCEGLAHGLEQKLIAGIAGDGMGGIEALYGTAYRAGIESQVKLDGMICARSRLQREDILTLEALRRMRRPTQAPTGPAAFPAQAEAWPDEPAGPGESGPDRPGGGQDGSQGDAGAEAGVRPDGESWLATPAEPDPQQAFHEDLPAYEPGRAEGSGSGVARGGPQDPGA